MFLIISTPLSEGFLGFFPWGASCLITKPGIFYYYNLGGFSSPGISTSAKLFFRANIFSRLKNTIIKATIENKRKTHQLIPTLNKVSLYKKLPRPAQP